MPNFAMPKRAQFQFLMLPPVVLIILAVGLILLLLFPFIGIYRLIVSPMVQWAIVIIAALFLLSEKHVRGFIKRIIRM